MKNGKIFGSQTENWSDFLEIKAFVILSKFWNTFNSTILNFKNVNF